MKKKVVILSFYLSGIYPQGDDSVVLNLLAPAYLKAALDSEKKLSEKYETVILDITTETNQEEILKRIDNENPSIVAYSVYIWNFEQSIESSKLIKKLRPNVKIIMGGPQVSYDSINILENNSQIDVIVKDAGELIFKMLLETDLTAKGFSTVPGISYRDNDKVLNSLGIVKQQDLNLVPSPYQTKAINLDDGKKHTVCVELSRGCIFRCKYCVWGDRSIKMHKFPLDQILKDIEIIYNSPNVKVVYFVDSCIFYMREYAEKIIDKITTCKYKDIPTILTLDARVLNERMISYLQKVNLINNQYQFGLQASHSDTLRTADRYYVKERFKQKIDLLRKADPKACVALDVIFGLPDDNFEKFKDTINFGLTLKAERIAPSPLLLLPGTPFFQDKDKYGFKADSKPPYMVLSNNTYSEEDMKKTHSFVLWYMAIMYFPALRNTIIKISETDPSHRPVDLIVKLIDIIKSKVNPEEGITLEPTIENNNLNRRKFMNVLAKSKNSLKMYQSGLELLKICKHENLSKEITDGINYYTKVSQGYNEEKNPSEFRQLDIAAIRNVKTSWITAHTADI